MVERGSLMLMMASFIAAGLAMQPSAPRCSRASRLRTSHNVVRTSLCCSLASEAEQQALTSERPEQKVLASEPQALGTASMIQRIEDTLTGDPQALLEAVVGLPHTRATYDRDAIVEYFSKRPGLMAVRALDFLNAFRRVRAAWTANGDDGQDRGAVLRQELSALGPVSVKIGQTLSQRPDILPEDVCEALKELQTNNAPFEDELAFQVMAEEFNAEGPLAPGIPVTPGCNPDAPPLFAKLSPTCIASASLGQVYRGTTHEGLEIAVKVQRPDALRRCLLDGSVLIAALKAIQGRYWNGDLLEIFDLVAGGVVEELDFRHEASNCKQFGESLRFLGYVDVPVTIPELTKRRAMAMEWVYGRHLSDLSPEEAMRMTHMSVEAVTAGLVLTGLVHADPHEGNIMLADDGRLVFLDFGLMSRVEEDIMEAFASGIQCVLSKDYDGLVKSFMATGFIGTPIEWREKEADPWQTTHPDGPAAEVMAKELRERMEACPGGGSRFGALSVVLGDMGYFWQMYTPPYIILLIRTFLTLEGIAGKVDPNFNIYEVALPWAVERALSPATAAGIEALRSSLLTRENQFQWERVHELVEQQRNEEREQQQEKAAATPQAASARARLLSQEASTTVDPAIASGASAAAQAANAATPLDSLVKVLGSPQGATLRRMARDIDSTALLLALGAPDARAARRLAVDKLVDALSTGVEQRASTQRRRLIARLGRLASHATPLGTAFIGRVVPTALGRSPSDPASSPVPAAVIDAATDARARDVALVENPVDAQPWPTSQVASRLRARTTARAKAAGGKLLALHLRRQIAAGWRGAAAVGVLAAVVGRVVLAAFARSALRISRAWLPPPVAAVTASAAAYSAVLAVPAKLVAATAAAAVAVCTLRGRDTSTSKSV